MLAVHNLLHKAYSQFIIIQKKNTYKNINHQLNIFLEDMSCLVRIWK